VSSVRMCDRCGNIFSENDLDWSTATGTKQRRRENGTRYTEQTTIDQCASCTNGGPAVTIPKLPTAIAAGTVVGSAAAADAAEREDDHVAIRNLERQLADLRAGMVVVDPASSAAAAPYSPSDAAPEPARF
jgi:hypothetical protein